MRGGMGGRGGRSKRGRLRVRGAKRMTHNDPRGGGRSEGRGEGRG